MTNKVNLATTLGKKLVSHYSRPNKFITWYCDPRRLTGAWLTAPWCAMFASFVYKSAGLAKEAGQFASCPAWVKFFKAEKRWGSVPKVGAAVFYDWNGDGVADHVGIVTKVGTTSIKAVEGNTRKDKATNWVYEQTRKRSAVMGYGYVDEAPKATTYTVRKGDTLARIAKVYDVTWQALYADNRATIGAKPELIKPGMVLVVP